jgi:serine/threonine-protein kinase
MSEVWLARHAQLALPVVFKTLHSKGTEPEEARATRLFAEARLMARLTSPRVVRVLDVGVHSDPKSGGSEPLPYLVEEYVDGVDLDELDSRRRAALKRPLPLWAVASFVTQVADGLHAAHQAGVIHRDVKPANLFQYGHGEVKVGDFGVAVCVATAAAVRPAGTPAFMAPEQLSMGPVDRRADVYSLGATAFALRYGFAPFQTLEAAQDPNAQPRFPPPSSPQEAYFQHVLARMMAREAETRYPNLFGLRKHFETLARAAPSLTVTALAEGGFAVQGVNVSFEVGDISRVETDAIVNSAYSEMRMRSGVGEALRRHGGDAIEDEAMAGGERPLGDCVRTGAGDLRCRAVLHAVGAWKEVSCVARATQRALQLAEEGRLARLALPAIGAGRGAVPLEACADAMVGALRQHLLLGGSGLREVRFMLRDPASHRRFTEVAEALLAGSEDDLGPARVDRSAALAPTVLS